MKPLHVDVTELFADEQREFDKILREKCKSLEHRTETLEKDGIYPRPAAIFLKKRSGYNVFLLVLPDNSFWTIGVHDRDERRIIVKAVE